MGTNVRRFARELTLPSGPFDDGILMLLDGSVWVILPAFNLYLRPPTVPSEVAAKVDPTDAMTERFVLSAKAERPRIQERAKGSGSGATIANIPVDGDVLEAIEKTFPGVRLLWGLWRGYFVARDARGVVVALWKLPDRYKAADVFMVEVDGALWAANNCFAMQMPTPPPEQLANIRRSLVQDPDVVDGLRKVIATPPGRVVEVKLEDGACFIGPTEVPKDQYQIVTARHPHLVWHWTGPIDPVIGRSGDRSVAFLQPIIGETPGGSA